MVGYTPTDWDVSYPYNITLRARVFIYEQKRKKYFSQQTLDSVDSRIAGKSQALDPDVLAAQNPPNARCCVGWCLVRLNVVRKTVL